MEPSAPAAEMAAPARVEGQAGAPAPSRTVPASMTRKLVRTVSLDLEVKSTEDAAAAAQALASRVGGYVGSVEAQRREGVLYYRITLRVPVEQLDAALAEIKKMAVRVNHESQSVQDVTTEYVDLDARIRTLQATERELQALLAESRQRGSKVEDIMAVYRELTGIRSQIEQIQAQLKNLEQLAALSTINLTLNPVETAKPVAANEWNPGGTFRMSLRTLVTLLRAAGDFAIFAGVVLLPLGLAVWLVVWLVKKARRRVTPGGQGSAAGGGS